MTSQRKKGALLSYLFMAIEIFSGMFFTPFLIRSFGQAEYGVYSLVTAVTAYLYMFDLGIGNSIIRYMAKFRVVNDKDKQKALMALTLVFYFLVGLIIIIAGLVLNHNFGRIFGKGLSSNELSRGGVMFFITMLNAALTLMVAPFHKTIIAFEKFTFSKISDIIKIILRISISVIVLFFGGKGIGIVAVNFAMTVLFSFITIVYYIVKIRIKPVFGKIEKGFVKEVFSYSIIVFVQMLATQLNNMVDQILIGSLVASSAAIIGVYTIGTHLGTYMQSFASSINGVLMPGVVRMVETTKDKKVIEKEMIRISRMVFMMLSIIYVVFTVFGDDFIVLWAGAENYQAYYVGVIIMLPWVITLSQTIGSQILWALNRHKVQAILQILVALSNIILTTVLIQWNPLLGASIATAITYFVGNVVIYNIVYTKYIGISMLTFYKGIFKGIIPALGLSIIVGLLIQTLHLKGWIGFIINCSCMTTVYIAFMLFKGMTEYEKQLIYSLFKKFTFRRK